MTSNRTRSCLVIFLACLTAAFGCATARQTPKLIVPVEPDAALSCPVTKVALDPSALYYPLQLGTDTTYGEPVRVPKGDGQAAGERCHDAPIVFVRQAKRARPLLAAPESYIVETGMEHVEAAAKVSGTEGGVRIFSLHQGDQTTLFLQQITDGVCTATYRLEIADTTARSDDPREMWQSAQCGTEMPVLRVASRRQAEAL